MPNPPAPVDGQSRRVPFLVDPDNPGTAYLAAGEGGIDMGAGRTDAAAAYVVPVKSDTATRTSVASADSDTLLLAANPQRRGAYIFNASAAILYVGLGTAAVTDTDNTATVAAGGYFEGMPENFVGEIRGCWASVDGAAKVTELTTEGWLGS
jgi:hypothetical protein